MICARCQKMNQENATYCPYCGLTFTESQRAAARESASAVSQNEDLLRNGTLRESMQSSLNQPADKTNNLKEYWTYFILNAKSPAGYSSKIGADRLLEGIATLFLTVIFYSLSFYIVIRTGDVSFIQTVLSAMLKMSAAFLIIIGLLFAVIKYWWGLNRTIMHIAARTGAFSSIAVVFFVFMLFLSLLGSAIISIFNPFFYILLATVIYSVLDSYLKESNVQKSPFYPTLLITLAVLIISTYMLQSTITFL